MKITDATMEIYRWDRPVPIRNGRYTYPTVALNLIKLETDEGITGYGYMGGEHVTDDMTMGTFNNMKQFVIGQDPFDNERLWDEMWQPKLVGRRGTSTRAISGIDIALWDIKGKATDTSVHKLLGAYTDRIPVYIAGGYYEIGGCFDDGFDLVGFEVLRQLPNSLCRIAVGSFRVAAAGTVAAGECC